MNAMQGFDAINDGFTDGLHAVASVFARRSSDTARYNALYARYRYVLAERDYNAEIYREVVHKHNALVDQIERLKQRIEDLED